MVALPRKSGADGDGRADIFFRHGVTGDVNVWLPSVQPATRPGSGNVGNVADPDWVIFGTGDFDGDGKADRLWRNSVHDVGQGTLAPSTTFSVSKFENVGSSAWQTVAP